MSCISAIIILAISCKIIFSTCVNNSTSGIIKIDKLVGHNLSPLTALIEYLSVYYGTLTQQNKQLVGALKGIG